MNMDNVRIEANIVEQEVSLIVGDIQEDSKSNKLRNKSNHIRDKEVLPRQTSNYKIFSQRGKAVYTKKV